MKLLIFKHFIKKNLYQIILAAGLSTLIVLLGSEEQEIKVPKKIEYENKVSEAEVSYNSKENSISLLENYKIKQELETAKEIELLKQRILDLEKTKQPQKDSSKIEEVTQKIRDTVLQKSSTAKRTSLSQNSRMRQKKKIQFPVGFNKPVFTQTIPKGSYMRAVMLNGVESKSGGLEPVILSIEGNTIMPNNFHANLKNCVALGKAQGEESNERVCIQIHDIACLDKSGVALEKKINGFITDSKDNTNCAIGKVNSKQNGAVYSSAIANVIKSASDIIAASASTTITTPLGGLLESTTKQKDKILASGLSGGASTLADWYLKRANTLMPTINIGSGREVWIVTLDSIEIPKSFLKE